MCSCKDIRKVTKTSQSPVPLELAYNVEHKDITSETENVPPSLSFIGSSQTVEHREVSSAVMEQDHVLNMDKY